VHIAARFLDDVVDANHYPLLQTERLSMANRKIGLGVMGFADMLFLLRVPYDSDKALAIGEEVMAFVSQEARTSSARLAESRGAFPNYPLSTFAKEGARLRNAAITTIAPTGTISLIAGCSSGIEPVFAISYRRRILEEQRELAMHPLFEKAAAPYLTEKARRAILETGSAQHVQEVPEEIRRVFVAAHDIEPEWHVRMQAAFQHHVDAAVSKTVNLRATATRQEVGDVYRLAHRLGCKGITVFRDGCKGEQVLSAGEAPRRAPAGAGVCPECGGATEHVSGCISCPYCGYAFCTI
jgi:ribonucleoside-diphosphate reductase alpha chain